MTPFRIVLSALALAAGASVAFAQEATPIDVVRPFYETIGSETDPANRDRFADPARTILDDNDALAKSGQGYCLDPGLALDNAAYDADELKASLKLQENVEGDQAKVVSSFKLGGEPHRMQWMLKKVDGAWKIADVLSVTGEWSLSQYNCKA